MSLIKKHRPFLTSRQVAERIGGISAKSVINGKAIAAELTRYPLGWRALKDGTREPSRIGFCPDEVDALIARIRKEADDQKERCRLQHEKNLRSVAGGTR